MVHLEVMKLWNPQLFLKSALIYSLVLTPVVADEGGAKAPRTISELFRQMGEMPGKETQLKLKLEAVVTGKDLGTFPESMEIEVFYDKERSRVMVVNDSTYPDGGVKRSVTMSTKERAAIWSEPRSNALAEKPDDTKINVIPVEVTKTLPNPFTIPVKLAFPGLFTDALHGYQSLSKEYSMATRLNKEPDSDGLVWFDMRPSKKPDRAVRRKFNEGLEVKAGFAAEGGWLKQLEVKFAETEVVMKLKVTEQATELSEAELAAIEIPERVVDKVTAMSKVRSENKEPTGGKKLRPIPPPSKSKDRGTRDGDDE